MCVVCFLFSSKENNSALDTCELGSSKLFLPGPVESDSGQNSNVSKEELKAEETAEGHDNLPLEKHCENLWVEVEKKDLKPSIRIVADHLGGTFEELLQPLSVEKKAAAAAESASTSSSLSSSPVEVEARSVDHFSSSTQSESKLKDSTDNSVYEDRLHVQNHQTSLNNWHQDPDQVAEEEQRASSLKSTREQKDESRPGVSGVTKTRFLRPLVNRNPTSVPRISDEELEENVQRFKHEVGKLRSAFGDRKKEHPHLQNEVEDDGVDCLTVSAF